ncbi:unnamed protein product [Polarella glacialis]|uniref:Uncharacterized protein n=1 Tax=Polarella glacialis TaxID=89957 RepID=A0A813HLD9_POLGL|nr:unnamed protein product [Polarella glacialis]
MGCAASVKLGQFPVAPHEASFLQVYPTKAKSVPGKRQSQREAWGEAGKLTDPASRTHTQEPAATASSASHARLMWKRVAAVIEGHKLSLPDYEHLSKYRNDLARGQLSDGNMDDLESFRSFFYNPARDDDEGHAIPANQPSHKNWMARLDMIRDFVHSNPEMFQELLQSRRARSQLKLS